MGKLIPQPDDVRSALEQHLAPGERMLHAAYGLQQSAPLMVLVILALMIPAALINLMFIGSRAGLFGTLTFFIIWMGSMALVTPTVAQRLSGGIDRSTLADGAGEDPDLHHQPEPCFVVR